MCSSPQQFGSEFLQYKATISSGFLRLCQFLLNRIIALKYKFFFNGVLTIVFFFQTEIELKISSKPLVDPKGFKTNKSGDIFSKKKNRDSLSTVSLDGVYRARKDVV